MQDHEVAEAISSVAHKLYTQCPPNEQGDMSNVADGLFAIAGGLTAIAAAIEKGGLCGLDKPLAPSAWPLGLKKD